METPTLQNHDAPSVLREYCQRSTPVTIRPLVDRNVFPAVFASCSLATLKFDLPRHTAVVFPNSGTCSVFFCDGATAYHFMASVLEPSGPTQAVLTMPTQITVERRSSLRVPIHAGLHVQMTTDHGRVVAARPQNLSLSGMFVGISPSEDPGLAVDERIMVELCLAGESTCLAGRIRSRVGNNLGVTFSGDRVGPEPDSLVDLQRIYAVLRQQTLAPKIVKTGCLPSGTIAVPIRHVPSRD